MLCTDDGVFYSSAGVATSVLLRALANSPVFPPAAIRLAMKPSSPTKQKGISCVSMTLTLGVEYARSTGFGSRLHLTG